MIGFLSLGCCLDRDDGTARVLIPFVVAPSHLDREEGLYPDTLSTAARPFSAQVYQKQNMATVEDIIYLQASETDPSVRCGAGGLLLTRQDVAESAGRNGHGRMGWKETWMVG